MSFSLSQKICIFPKGLTHDSGQKFEIFPLSLLFFEEGLDVFFVMLYIKKMAF